MKEAAVEYLMNTYHPRALLVYGSYVHGDQDEYSDYQVDDERRDKVCGDVLSAGHQGGRDGYGHRCVVEPAGDGISSAELRDYERQYEAHLAVKDLR